MTKLVCRHCGYPPPEDDRHIRMCPELADDPCDYREQKPRKDRLPKLAAITPPPEQWEDDEGNDAAKRFLETVQEGLDGSERMIVFYVKISDTSPKRKYTTCAHDITKGPHHKVSYLEMLALLQKEINEKLRDS